MQFAIGRAASAPTLSHIMEGNVTWELNANTLAGVEGDTTEEQMGAQFQKVVNQLWASTWERAVNNHTASTRSQTHAKCKEDDNGLLQPMIGGRFKGCHKQNQRQQRHDRAPPDRLLAEQSATTDQRAQDTIKEEGQSRSGVSYEGTVEKPINQFECTT